MGGGEERSFPYIAWQSGRQSLELTISHGISVLFHRYACIHTLVLVLLVEKV